MLWRWVRTWPPPSAGASTPSTSSSTPFDRRRPRAGAAALALVNGGVLVESLYLLALYSSLRFGWHSRADLVAPCPWLLARALPVLGTAFAALLILRSLSRRAGEEGSRCR